MMAAYTVISATVHSTASGTTTHFAVWSMRPANFCPQGGVLFTGEGSDEVAEEGVKAQGPQGARKGTPLGHARRDSKHGHNFRANRQMSQGACGEGIDGVEETYVHAMPFQHEP
eukprot:1634040-Pyramimonas_sp.AAC.2